LLNQSGNREGIGAADTQAEAIRQYSRRITRGIAIHSSADFNN
jgi:hypothetical protein